jgi:hypothetical protein
MYLLSHHHLLIRCDALVCAVQLCCHVLQYLQLLDGVVIDMVCNLLLHYTARISPSLLLACT